MLGHSITDATLEQGCAVNSKRSSAKQAGMGQPRALHHPCAATSSRGAGRALTVMRLGVPKKLERVLSSINPI
jgi:hypothetical protein